MTKLPRDLSASVLVERLRRLGYSVVRQHGSHMTLFTAEHGGHRAWVPKHNPIAPGTLSSVLKDIAAHFSINVDELRAKLGL